MEAECVPLVELLRRLRGVLEPGTLGTVLDAITHWHLGGSRRRMFRLIMSAEIDDLLPNPDFFIAACARTQLKTRRLLRYACAHPRTPGSSIALVGRLMAAGALNVFVPSACAELCRMLARWPPLELRRALIGGIIGEIDTYTRVGMFLRGLLDADPAGLGGAQAIEDMLRAVLCDIRVSGDLEGAPADLAAELPPEWAPLVVVCIGSGDGLDGSDVDSDGNLAGFVVADGSVSVDDGEAASEAASDAVPPPSDLVSSPQAVGRRPAGLRRLRRLRDGGGAASVRAGAPAPQSPGGSSQSSGGAGVDHATFASVGAAAERPAQGSHRRAGLKRRRLDSE